MAFICAFERPSVLPGIQEAAKKHNGSAKLSLHFRADESGIVSLEKGEATSEIMEEYTVKVPVLPEGVPADLKKALENITWPEGGLKNETSGDKVQPPSRQRLFVLL